MTEKENDRIKQLEKIVEDLRDEIATQNWIIDRQCAEIAKLKKRKTTHMLERRKEGERDA